MSTNEEIKLMERIAPSKQLKHFNNEILSDPYKLYKDSFKKKGQSKYSLYKSYNLGMLWCSLSFALFALDAVNPSQYVTVRINSSEEEMAQYDNIFNFSMRIAHLVTFGCAFIFGLVLLAWFSFIRKSIYTGVHYTMHFGTLIGLGMAVLLEYICILVFYFSLSGDDFTFAKFSNVSQLIYVFRAMYGVALAIHELCAYKLLAEMCETVESSPGIIIAFALTSHPFKFAFDKIISLQDWISLDQVLQISLVIGTLIVISIGSYCSLEVYQYIQNNHNLLRSNLDIQKDIDFIVKKGLVNSKSETFYRKLMNSITSNILYIVMIIFVLLMTCLFRFGVQLTPMESGGMYWSQIVDSSRNDAISLGLAIQFIVLVTLPLFGAVLDQGGQSKSSKKTSIQLRELKEHSKTLLHNKSFNSTHLTTKSTTTTAEKISKSFRLKFRIVLLCIGMILSISCSFFYVTEIPDDVPMYDFILNVVTFMYAIGVSICTCSTYLIPKYYFSIKNKREIEEKALKLKKNLNGNVPKYLHYLYSIFYEQTEFSGIRFMTWFACVSLVKEAARVYHSSVVFNMDAMIITAVLVISLSFVLFVFFLLLSYFDFKYMVQKSRNADNRIIENHPSQPLIDDSNSNNNDSTNNRFDPSHLFSKPSLGERLRDRGKSWILYVGSILTWPIDLMMSLNLLLFVICVSGVPTVLIAIYESTQPSTRQNSHPVEIVFLPCLFAIFIFTFYFVYKSAFLKFVGLHVFKWTRKMFDLIFDSPYSTIKGMPNCTYSFFKHEKDLLSLKKKRRDEKSSQLVDSSQAGKVFGKLYELAELREKNRDENEISLLENADHNTVDSYYVAYNDDAEPQQSTASINDNQNPAEEFNRIEELERKKHEFIIVTAKDDRVFPHEEIIIEKDTKRVKFQTFESKEAYVEYLNSNEFLEKFNDQEYSFTPITNGTVFVKKSKFSSIYRNERYLKYIRAIRPGLNFMMYIVMFYCGFFLIPEIFSWFQLKPMPTISNPYTFLIVSCNFVFGFLMFYPLISTWMDINQSVTASLKETIVLLEETETKFKVYENADTISYDSTTQIKINLARNKCYLLDKDFAIVWHKRMKYIQKTVDAKMVYLKNNLIIAFVITKAGSVVLSLISLFTNIEFTAQTIQPMYIILGLDAAVLFLVVDPAATLYYFVWRNCILVFEERVKIQGAVQNHEQDKTTTSALPKLIQSFQYIQFWSEKTRMRNIFGCRFDINGFLYIVIDQTMYQAWFYSLLATLPPAIVKLMIQKLFTNTGNFRL